MLNIQFQTIHSGWPFQRQITEALSEVINVRANSMSDEQEWCVVYDDLAESFVTHCPKDRRILFIAEPPEVKRYNKSYLNQFGHIVTPYGFTHINKPKQHIQQSALPWHFGVKHSDKASALSAEEIRDLELPHKQNKVSVICSKKRITEQQRKRLQLVEYLKEHLGDNLEIFGRGFKEVDDKAEGILPFQYHLVMENNTEEHFWTEKLADCYLGYAFPFYAGGKKVKEYFPGQSYALVDIDDHEGILKTIETALNTSDHYDHHVPFIHEAREKVIDQYNLFQVIRDIAKANPSEEPSLGKPQTIKPSSEGGIISKIRKAISRFKRVLS